MGVKDSSPLATTSGIFVGPDLEIVLRRWLWTGGGSPCIQSELYLCFRRFLGTTISEILLVCRRGHALYTEKLKLCNADLDLFCSRLEVASFRLTLGFLL